MLFGNEEAGPRPARSYQVMNGIAVLPVAGTLVNKTRSLQPYSGMTGYNGVIARLQQAISDPDVDGVLLDMDTPGGMVAGAFDCADIIARARDIKPVWALANDMKLQRRTAYRQCGITPAGDTDRKDGVYRCDDGPQQLWSGAEISGSRGHVDLQRRPQG
ncbi:serine peptidase [Klebsiella oxytoca]|nr:serine peptidase [Klebsiella oxytoca]